MGATMGQIKAVVVQCAVCRIIILSVSLPKKLSLLRDKWEAKWKKYLMNFEMDRAYWLNTFKNAAVVMHMHFCN